MDFLKEILIGALSSEKIEVYFPNLNVDCERLLEMKLLDALHRIRDIVRDETLTDKECFAKIEEIVCILEDIGSSGGIRHDF